MMEQEFDFFVSYGSSSSTPVVVTVYKKNGSRPDIGCVGISSVVDSAFGQAFKQLFGRQPDHAERRVFLDQVRQRESLEAQPQNVGL